MSSIITSRLVLRPLRKSDSTSIQEHFPHWEIVQHLGDQIPWPYPPDGATQFVAMRLKKIETSQDESWAITLKGSDELIGLLDYVAGDDEAGNRGFWLGQQWWGKGYMTEVVEAFHFYAFEFLKLERLTFVNAANNPASKRIKEKTGAIHVGMTRLRHLDGVEESDKWELTASQWRKNVDGDSSPPVIHP